MNLSEYNAIANYILSNTDNLIITVTDHFIKEVKNATEATFGGLIVNVIDGELFLNLTLNVCWGNLYPGWEYRSSYSALLDIDIYVHRKLAYSTLKRTKLGPVLTCINIVIAADKFHINNCTEIHDTRVITL